MHSVYFPHQLCFIIPIAEVPLTPVFLAAGWQQVLEALVLGALVLGALVLGALVLGELVLESFGTGAR